MTDHRRLDDVAHAQFDNQGNDTGLGKIDLLDLSPTFGQYLAGREFRGFQIEPDCIKNIVWKSSEQSILKMNHQISPAFQREREHDREPRPARRSSE